MNKIEYILSIFGLLLVIFLADARVRGDTGFDENYVVVWGQDHFLKLNQGNEVQPSMDISSGSGFESKQHYGSGFFQMRIKLPPNDTAGVVTTFYLTSKGNSQDEIDFEFLGNRQGKPTTVQTNLFTNGQGNREQKFVLWFDPTTDFHTYGILWNPYHTVFYVDKTPIRVFKNNTRYGVSYPTKPMQVVVSLWNGEAWAVDGGKTKINWAYAPFKAHSQGFSTLGCPVDESNNANICGSVTLSAFEQNELKNARAKYMTYDYCSDRIRFHVPPTECEWNQ